MQSSESLDQSFTIFPTSGKFFPTSAGKSWRRMVKANKQMKTITKSARLNMKTKTNTLLGAVLFLLVIGASATIANAQDGTLVSWGANDYGQVSGMPRRNLYDRGR